MKMGELHVSATSKSLMLSHGCDIETLYNKYKCTTDGIENYCNMGVGTPSQTTHDETLKSKKLNTDSLNKYHICQLCHGHGIRKVIYNFVVREENCSECDSKGIVDTSIGKKAEKVDCQISLTQMSLPSPPLPR